MISKITLAISAFLLSVNTVFACWAAIPPEQQLSNAHLVITGKVTSTNWFWSSKRYVYIKVDEVLKNDLDGYPVEVGDKIKLILPPKSKPRMSTDFNLKNGTQGLWMLEYSNGDFRAPFPMVISSMSADKAKEILRNLQRRYAQALKTTIPKQEKYLKQILNHPAYSTDKAMKMLNKPLPEDIDLGKVYAQSHFPDTHYTSIVDSDGKVLSVIQKFTLGQFNDGWLQICNEKTQEHNFLNRKWKLLSPEWFKRVTSFSEERAGVLLNDGWGIVNASGELTKLPSLYLVLQAFSGGLAMRVKCNENGTRPIKKCYEVINIKGEVIADNAVCAHDGKALIRVSPSNWKLVNNKGETLYQFRLPDNCKMGNCDAKTIVSGLYPVLINNKYGFINTKGEMVIKPRFATVTNFSGGLAAFTEHNNYSLSLWGLIDKTGKVVVTPRFTEFRNAQYNPQTGYMAQVKELSWAPRREIESPGGKVKLASRAPKHSLQTRAGVITERGEWIILPVFEYISEFENDLAEVFIRQGISTPNAPFRALINRNGKIVFVLKNFFKQSHEEQ